MADFTAGRTFQLPYRSPYSDAIRAQEGFGLAHNAGTPRCPRRPWRWYPGGKGFPPQRQIHWHHSRAGARGRGTDARFRTLRDSGYYDAIRKAFEEAEE